MFHAMAMQRININLITEDAPYAALLLASTGCFAPYEQPLPEHQDLNETTGNEYQEIFHAAWNRYEKIQAVDRLPNTQPELSASRVTTLDELRKVSKWLTDTWAIFSAYEERLRVLEERERLLSNLTTTLDKFTGLDLDLGALRENKAFLDMRVGVIPEPNLTRFSQAIELAGYIIHVFHRKQSQAYVVIAGLINRQSHELRLVLDAANFNAIQIPAEFHDRPEVLSSELFTQKQTIISDRKKIERERDEDMAKNRKDLDEAWKTLKLIEPYVYLGASLRSRGGLSVINGWVPEKEVDLIESMLAESLQHACYIQKHSPKPTEYHDVPSAACYPGWLRSFARLIRNYGTPRYGEFDPTWVFMLTSVLMFGAMFGDIGQGAVIVISGAVLHRVFREYTTIVILNGASSIFFGFCYGSVFGNEHLIEPIWQSPLSNPAMVLEIAIYYGLSFVGLMVAINIYNQVRRTSYFDAIASVNGIAGLCLLHALYVSGVSWLSTDGLGIDDILILVIPSAVIFYHSWRTSDATSGERPIISAIELFESVIGYVSNTLSFLRVAAFSLNHIALMIAIFTIAGMMEETGYWLTIVLGNIFVIVFEGAIVMIQVLRLEYYEGLSRYFLGDGRLFKPMIFAGNPRAKYCYI